MSAPTPLERRVHFWQLGGSLLSALLLALAVPPLLQIAAPTRWQLGGSLFSLSLLGTILATTWTWYYLRQHRALLCTLAGLEQSAPRTNDTNDTNDTASASGDAGAPRMPSVSQMVRFATEPSRLTRGWLAPHLASLALLLWPFRPDALGWMATLSVVLLAGVILATASLPMHVLVRRDLLSVVERAPSALMHEVLAEFERTVGTRSRINRRIMIAVTTPVVFVALGSALIVNAHLRIDDESNREETARMLALAVLQADVGGASGLEHALRRARELGFPAELVTGSSEAVLRIEQGGIATLTVPTEVGATRVRFASSTVGVVGVAPLIVSLLAALAAAILGFLLGNVLSMDLYFATRGVRMLGASSVAMHQHTGVLRPPRLRLIAELAAAIDALTGRFGVFAQAQENAIRARSTAVRARGLFFASVSHDLKSPLNSILGFIHLVSLQPLTLGQRESVSAIETRAGELLALIETILDAARVEEGQLSLVTDEVPYKELHEAAIDKAMQLSSSFKPKIFEEIEDDIPPLLIDRGRMLRALATLIAYSVRSNEGGKMWIRAERDSETSVRVDIDVPHPAHTPEQLERMLSPGHEDEQREHRGMALGLRLARSVVKLHPGGSVRVVDRGKKGAMFCIKLPTLEAPLPSASAPLHSIPPPPLGKSARLHTDRKSPALFEFTEEPAPISSLPPSSARPSVTSVPPPPLVPSSAPPGSWRPPSGLLDAEAEARESHLPPPPVFPSSRSLRFRLNELPFGVDAQGNDTAANDTAANDAATTPVPLSQATPQPASARASATDGPGEQPSAALDDSALDDSALDDSALEPEAPPQENPAGSDEAEPSESPHPDGVAPEATPLPRAAGEDALSETQKGDAPARPEGEAARQSADGDPSLQPGAETKPVEGPQTEAERALDPERTDGSDTKE